MRLIPIILAALFLSTATLPAQSEDAHKHGDHAKEVKTEKAAPASVKGEIVDTGCYLGHEARGEKHISCATKCIRGGMPMGLLTDDGELFLLTMNHDNPDPYNELKELAGKTVTVTGKVMERSGMKGLDVTGFKLVAAATK